MDEFDDVTNDLQICVIFHMSPVEGLMSEKMLTMMPHVYLNIHLATPLEGEGVLRSGVVVS